MSRKIKKLPSGKFQAAWKEPSGKLATKSTFDREGDARKHQVRMEASVLDGTYVPEDRQVTIGVYARRWFSARTYAPKSIRSMEARVKRLERARIGQIKLADLMSILPVNNWIKEMTDEGLASRTVSLNVSTLNAVLNEAVAERLLPFNPMAGKVKLSLPRMVEKEVVFLTIDQVAQLADAMPARFRAMVLVQAGLGLRVAELLALRTSDINFLTREVKIATQLSERGARVEPKYGSRRTLTMTRQVADVLQAHMRAYPPLDDGTLFYRAAREGMAAGPLTHYYGDRFSILADRVAETDSTFPRGVTSHWLRHHFASVMIHEGMDILTVSKMLGHSSPAFTLARYGKIVPGALDQASAAVEAAWNDAGHGDVGRPATPPAGMDRRRKGTPGGRWEAGVSNVRMLPGRSQSG